MAGLRHRLGVEATIYCRPGGSLFRWDRHDFLGAWYRESVLPSRWRQREIV